jgi:acetyl esterase/lipase
MIAQISRSILDDISLVYAATALVVFLLLLLSSTAVGFALSELGMFLAWIPFSLVVVLVVFIINMKEVPELRLVNFILVIVGTIINIISFVGLLKPFYRFRKTKNSLLQSMKDGLGKDYLESIDPSIDVKYDATIGFRPKDFFIGFRRSHSKKNIVITKDVPYKKIDDSNLEFNVYYPKHKNDNPIIIFVHGGAWILGHKDRLRDESVCIKFANFGYTVFNVDYRVLLRNRKLSPVHMVQDIQDAYKFIQQHAEEYQGDPKRIFLFGRSAGAHLALLAAFIGKTRIEQKRSIKEQLDDFDAYNLAGVVVFYPPTDLNELYDSLQLLTAKSLLSLIMGGKPQNKRKEYQELSPIHYLDEDNADAIPPIFIVQGMGDKVVPPDQSINLHKRLQKLDITSVLLALPTANHAFDWVLNGPHGQVVYDLLTQFLAWALSNNE